MLAETHLKKPDKHVRVYLCSIRLLIVKIVEND